MAAMRLPSTHTCARNPAAPVPSITSTSRNNVRGWLCTLSAQNTAEIVPGRVCGASEKQERRLLGRELAAVGFDRVGLLSILRADQVLAQGNVAGAQPVLGLRVRAWPDPSDLIEIGAQLGIVQVELVAVPAGIGGGFTRIGDQGFAKSFLLLFVEACLDCAAAITRCFRGSGDLQDACVGNDACLTGLLAGGIVVNETERLLRGDRLGLELVVEGGPQSHDRFGGREPLAGFLEA